MAIKILFYIFVTNKKPAKAGLVSEYVLEK